MPPRNAFLIEQQCLYLRRYADCKIYIVYYFYVIIFLQNLRADSPIDMKNVGARLDSKAPLL